MSSEIKANKISPATGTAFTLGDSGDTFTVPSGGTLSVASGATISNSGTASGFGKILQVQYLQPTATESVTGTTLAASQLEKSITPSSTSSKILVQLTVQVSNSDGNPPQFVIYRDGSPAADLIGSGATSNRVNATGMGNNSVSGYVQVNHYSLIDEPNTTSSVTYRLYWASYSGTTYMNRSSADSDLYYTIRTPSSIILTEIAG